MRGLVYFIILSPLKTSKVTLTFGKDSCRF